MAKDGARAASLLVLLVLGGLIGSVLGEVIGALLPGGWLERLLARGVSPGLHPPFTLDLKVLTLTLGFSVKITLATILGMILAVVIWKRL